MRSPACSASSTARLGNAELGAHGDHDLRGHRIGAGDPVPGVEMSEARYFAAEALPEPLHRGHDRRIPVLLELARTGGTHHDAASTVGQDASTLPMFQRPA